VYILRDAAQQYEHANDVHVRQRRVKRSEQHRQLNEHDEVAWAEVQMVHDRGKRDLAKTPQFNDPLWEQQWYLVSEV
jgi:hypothetical protein